MDVAYCLLDTPDQRLRLEAHRMTDAINPKRAPLRHFFCYISAGCYFFALKLLDFFPSSLALDLTLNCIRGGFHGTQHLVFRLSHFNAAIFRADNFCNCLNSSYASFGEKKVEVRRVVFALISIN